MKRMFICLVFLFLSGCATSNSGAALQQEKRIADIQKAYDQGGMTHDEYLDMMKAVEQGRELDVE